MRFYKALARPNFEYCSKLQNPLLKFKQTCYRRLKYSALKLSNCFKSHISEV